MKTLYLPQSLRDELKKVWGTPIFGTKEEVVKKYNDFIEERGFKKTITVGDLCSLSLNSDIKIFDGKINRKTIEHSLSSSLNCSNPPATLREEAWAVVEKAIKENKNIFVEGEEDLLVIPAVLLSENGTAVIYGFFKKGICVIEVSQEIKNSFKELLNKFQKTT